MEVREKMKTITALFALALMASLTTTAGAGSPRTITLEYEGPNSIALPGGGVYFDNVPEQIKPRLREKFISAEVADEAGQTVLAAVHQGEHELGGDFCGESQPQKLVDRKAVHVHIYMGEGCDGVSLPTQGTVTLTFFRR
jgi:hypothetical protein